MSVPCFMHFLRSPCKYKAKGELDLKRHVKEIHEPEALAINGFDPGFDEPLNIHVTSITADGKVTKSLERSNQIFNIGDYR